nr:MAG TPA: hypothetical protein [Bacteriophage sp.]
MIDSELFPIYLSIGARYSLPSDSRIAYTQVPNGNSHPLFLSA